MSASRLILVHALLAVIVGASVYDIARRREHWPFSPYSMFSGARMNPQVWHVRLYGVAENGGEISLHDLRYLWPFDRTRMAHSFIRLRTQPEAKKLLGKAMQDCLRRYERRRLRGKHNGPRLVKLRLYDVHWQTDPHASDLDRPSARKLNREVALKSDAKP